LAAAKACFGHTEGSAGLSGALLASNSLNIATLPAIMHLRNLNTYVQAALTDWKDTCGFSAQMPRATLPKPHLLGGEEMPSSSIAGTSSFGMSGINAHMLLGQGGQGPKVLLSMSLFHPFRCGQINNV
jgi:acyl transferase domain-containing protein